MDKKDAALNDCELRSGGCILANQIKGCHLTECKVDHNVDAKKAFAFGRTSVSDLLFWPATGTRFFGHEVNLI